MFSLQDTRLLPNWTPVLGLSPRPCRVCLAPPGVTSLSWLCVPTPGPLTGALHRTQPRQLGSWPLCPAPSLPPAQVHPGHWMKYPGSLSSQPTFSNPPSHLLSTITCGQAFGMGPPLTPPPQTGGLTLILEQVSQVTAEGWMTRKDSGLAVSCSPVLGVWLSGHHAG